MATADDDRDVRRVVVLAARSLCTTHMYMARKQLEPYYFTAAVPTRYCHALLSTEGP